MAKKNVEEALLEKIHQKLSDINTNMPVSYTHLTLPTKA